MSRSDYSDRGSARHRAGVPRSRAWWGLGLVGGAAIVSSIAVLPGIAAAGAAAAQVAPLGVSTTVTAPAPPAVGAPAAAAPVAGDPDATPASDVDPAAVRAFLDAGYTYEDALVLLDRWGAEDELEVKAAAGAVLAGGTPLSASAYADPAAAQGRTPAELAAFFAESGYDDEDAFVLADVWGTTIEAAQARGGEELKTVGVLPFVDPPSRDPYAAFYAAGYDYDDSVLLAEYWGSADSLEAKAEANRLLMAGQQLPDVPGVDPS